MKHHARDSSDEEASVGMPDLQVQKRMFTFLFSKKVPPVPLPEERTEYPWKRARYASRMVFFWLWPVLIKGYKRTLVADDLWYLPTKLTVEDMHRRYRENLDKILATRKDEEEEWPVWAVPLALYKTFKFDYTLSCIFLAISFVCQALSPLITRRLIDFVQDRYFGLETTYNKGIAYTIGAVVLIFINGLLLNHFFHKAMATGACVKLVLTKDVLVKSFALLAQLRRRFPAGQITSLMSTDLLRVDLAVGFQPLVVCFPIPVVIAVVLLLHNIGVTSLVGIGLFFVSLVACVLLTSKLFFTREAVVEHTDERIGLMREVLAHLKVIKFYAWELAYKANITKVREREMRYLFTIKVLRNFITAYAVTLPTLTSMVSFVTMWATGNMKQTGQVFLSLSLFSILAQAIMLLPIALATGADATIGFRRLREFLSAEEQGASGIEKPHAEWALQVEDADFQWGGEDEADKDEDEDEDEKNEKTKAESTAEIETPQVRRPAHVYRPDIARPAQNIRISVPQRDDLADISTAEIATAEVARNIRHTDRDNRNNRDNTNNRNTNNKNTNNRNTNNRNTNNTNNRNNTNNTKGTFHLAHVTLAVPAGNFVVVTGAIGSGKTTLLHALAGLMEKTHGKFAARETLLCGAPWIQNATVRQNILFGRPMDWARYHAVLHACCLQQDLRELPGGDQCEIGERGVTLSGGQKARLSLARAAYRGAPVMLFDDVLSAVDARVGKHIATHLFHGLLQGCTRIVATHQLSLVRSADQVVFLGDRIEVGRPRELLARSAGFRLLMAHDSTDTHTNGGLDGDDGLDTTNSDFDEDTLGSDNLSNASLRRKSDQFSAIVAEDVAVNAVSWDVYRQYIVLGAGVFGRLAVPVFLFLVALATFCQLFTNTWLSFWMEGKFRLLDRFYVAFYVLFAVLTVFFTGIQFTMLAYMNNRSAELLNVRAMEKVLHAPMSFMDTNPMGRVLNRFTKDTDSVDNEIGEQLRLFIFPAATIVGIIILCICYLPYFAIAVPFLAGVFVFLSDVYSGSAREIKRLEAVQRLVVYNNFNETLTGMATIQAYRAEQDFVAKNDRLLDRMNEAYLLSIATQRWLCVHLDVIALMFALVICMLCITEQFNISASLTGLLLNYVIQIVGLLSLTVRAMTQVETEMNSVERLHDYAFHMPQEAAYEKAESRPAPEWPMAGYINFRDVSLRYRPQLPLVLKDLSFGVYPGEKVGICGRTGAGKSSLMTALYRLTELESGQITIDGVDIAHIGLRDLRSQLLIIPQDPVLFQGTVRRNLDPFGEYSDSVLRDAMRRAGGVLEKFALDRAVDDDGGNFSLGEKQLVALARALVRGLKILILDEATSSVDYATDARIQETIAREFSHCTILCIAHRLKTILNYDRILVMDQGRVVEKGTPWALYQQKGVFSLMCHKAQIGEEDFGK